MPASGEVDPDDLAQWCLTYLGSPPGAELSRSGNLSAVIALRLVDGREAVVKIRPDSPRVAACVEVQRRLFQAGYPCPRPMTDPAPFGSGLATAEAYLPGGDPLPTSDAATAFAEAFAWLIRLAPHPAEVPALDPSPSWADWNRPGDALWPRPEGDAVDLNQIEGPQWIDDAGRLARDRLRTGGAEPVIGHCDWLAGNLRWKGDTLLVVHDWDSVISDSEDVLVGFAAALHPGRGASQLATTDDSERFRVAYSRARDREFSTDEVQRFWAAGVWTRAIDAKYQYAVGMPITSLSEQEARERLGRAGIG